jgi:hypothetical protein
MKTVTTYQFDDAGEAARLLAKFYSQALNPNTRTLKNMLDSEFGLAPAVHEAVEAALVTVCARYAERHGTEALEAVTQAAIAANTVY